MQKNEIAIQPINTWVNGQMKTLSVLRLDNYFHYDFLLCPGQVHYCLCEEVQTYNPEDQQYFTEYPSVIDGVVEMTWPLIDSWGSDDTPIFDYVLQTLNLQRL